MIISCIKNIPPTPIHRHLNENQNLSFFDRMVQLRNVLHPRPLACSKQPAKVDGSMNPLVASAGIPGFPITSLESGIPAFAIWKRADPVDDAVKRLLHVVYSVVPSVNVLLFSNLASRRRWPHTIIELRVQKKKIKLNKWLVKTY